MIVYYCTLQRNALISKTTACNPGLDSMISDWLTTDIEVRVRESHDDDTLINKVGVIRSMSVSCYSPSTSNMFSYISCLT